MGLKSFCNVFPNLNRVEIRNTAPQPQITFNLIQHSAVSKSPKVDNLWLGLASDAHRWKRLLKTEEGI